MIRAVIIDDEYLARERIAKLLQNHEEIQVIGEAKNGGQAVEIINMKEPELVFLDVQMPDFDGFEVVNRITPKNQPYIVFATAYDSYAIEAFNIHALDYLLKPIDEDRFNESIGKVLNHFEGQKNAAFNQKLMKMIRDFERPTEDYISRIVIADRGWEHEVALNDVLYIEANGNYVNLNTSNKTHLYRITMNALSDQLNPEEFLRIHRSIIVNKRYIKKTTYLNNNEYQITMKDGSKLVSGRSYKQAIQQYLN